MDHVVRIDGGSDTKAPIVLHLLPGEETIFNLVLINEREPSDVSLLASDPVFKAVRFRRSVDHVDGKQIIPIFARMPDNTDRLDGEIILKSESGISHVPITILRDSMGPDADRLSSTPSRSADRSGPSAPSVPSVSPRRSGRPASRARIREIAPAKEETAEDYREEERNPDLYGIDLDIIDPNGLDDSGKDEDENEDHDPEDPEEDTEFIPARDSQGGEEEKDGGHISFSKDTDLERYRSARRFRRIEDLLPDEDNNNSDERTGLTGQRGYSTPADDYFAADDHPDQDLESFFGPQGGGRAPSGTGEGNGDSGEESEEQFDLNSIRSGELAREGIEEEDDGAIGAIHIIPAIIFLGLVSALVLTFITESIPEFPGALVSSILIVTLIIYGAATLLKA